MKTKSGSKSSDQVSDGVWNVYLYCTLMAHKSNLLLDSTASWIMIIGQCFLYKMKSIHLPSDIRSISRGLFKNCRSLLKCYLADSIEVIEDEAFSGCTMLKKPWIPKSIKRIGETAFDNPEWRR